MENKRKVETVDVSVVINGKRKVRDPREHHHRRSSTDDETEVMSQRQIYKSLVLVSVSFFFTFVSYNGLEGLESSLNIEDGIGQVSIAVIYIILISSSLTFAPVAVARLTPKWTMAVSWLSYILFTLANFYPTWWTMIPSAVIGGIGGSMVWISQGVYVTTLALNYAASTGKCRKAVMVHFNSIFTSIYAMSMIFGNLVASLLLNLSTTRSQHHIFERDNFQNLTAQNQTGKDASHQYRFENASDPRQVCGAGHCPYLMEHTATITRPDDMLVYLLLSTFLICNIVALLITFFLDNPKAATTQNKTCERLGRTLSLLKDWRILLFIIPMISMRTLASMSTGSFTLSFVSCSVGIGMVGYVMMARAACYSLASFLCGKTAKYVHRGINFSISMLFYGVVITIWLLWQPEPDQLWMFFFVACLEGTGSGIWRVHITAMLGGMFQEEQEAAFAHFTVWMSAGSCVTFLYGNYLCFYTKAYLTAVVVALSLVSYTALEALLKRQERRKRLSSNSSATPMMAE